MINPITTLIETLIDQQGVRLVDALAIAQSALGISSGIDLLAYDPLAPSGDSAQALGVQKTMVQLALLATLAGDGAAAMSGVSALAADSAGVLDLGSTTTISAALAAIAPSAQTVTAIAQANTRVQQSTSAAQVAAAQLQAIDTVAPVVASSTPVNGAAAVAIGNNLTLSFSEPISRGSGNIVLKTAAGMTVATYDAATSTRLALAGNTLTIDPVADLGYSTDYVLELAAGSLRDVAGNPYAGASGADAYRFTTVAAPNSAPVAANAGVVLNEDSTLSATLPTATDADGDTITYARTTSPAHGTATVNANGSYTYQPAADYFGSDSFGYSVSDGKGGINSYTLSITVNGVTDTLSGGAGIDTLTDGTGGPSVLNALAGDDTLRGNTGNDTLNGGAGIDTAVYGGPLAGYTLTRSAGTVTVSGGSANEGTDTLSGIEQVRFSDMTVNLQVQAQAAAAPLADVQRIMELYVAFFNRVPDADGLSYWVSVNQAGQTVNQIAESFYAAGVLYSALTGFSASMTNADFVNVVYRNVLGRPDGADAGGLAYWGGELVAGRESRGSLVSTILYSAHTFKGKPSAKGTAQDGYGWVADLLDNKLAVAKTFAVDWGLTYNTPQDSISKGIAIAAAVTELETTAAITLIGVPVGQIGLG